MSAHIVKLVRVGNSRGVRLPKPLIDRLGGAETFEASVEHGVVILRPRHAVPLRPEWPALIEQALDAAGDDAAAFRALDAAAGGA